MTSGSPGWSELARVLTTVATGDVPGDDDRTEVEILVRRGLLERVGTTVRLTALGVIVVDEEHCC